jgi:hypothetical protein
MKTWEGKGWHGHLFIKFGCFICPNFWVDALKDWKIINKFVGLKNEWFCKKTYINCLKKRQLWYKPKLTFKIKN